MSNIFVKDDLLCFSLIRRHKYYHSSHLFKSNKAKNLNCVLKNKASNPYEDTVWEGCPYMVVSSSRKRANEASVKLHESEETLTWDFFLMPRKRRNEKLLGNARGSLRCLKCAPGVRTKTTLLPRDDDLMLHVNRLRTGVTLAGINQSTFTV